MAMKSSCAVSASGTASRASVSASAAGRCCPQRFRQPTHHRNRAMQAIETRDAPTPAGHYSQAIVHNGVVYVAGQLPIDPADHNRAVGSIEEQAERTLRNVE